MNSGFPVSYKEFGVSNISLYREYLAKYPVRKDVVGSRLILDRSDVFESTSFLPGADSKCLPASSDADTTGQLARGFFGSSGNAVSGGREASGDRVCGVRSGALGGGGDTKGVDCVVQGKSSACESTAEVDGLDSSSGTLRTRGDVPSSAVGVERGRNYKRNKAKRERRRRVVDQSLDDGVVGSTGFWGSCSEETRQQLIESKAKMHIAENERRAQVAKDEVVRLQSPEGLIQRAMAMVKMAEECAKKQENSAVAGWAATVASSYAESVAMSAPSSVPSYASVASSKSSVSVDGVKRGKYVPKVKSRVEQIKTEISKLMKLHQAMVYRENFKGDNSIQGNVKFELSEILRERIEFLNRNRMT